MSVVPLREQLSIWYSAGQMHALTADFNYLGIEIDHQVARGDDRLGMTPERRTIAWFARPTHPRGTAVI